MLAVADVAVTVADAKKSAEWWQEKLGFDIHTIGPPGGHAIMIAPPGDRFVLHLCEGIEAVEPGNTGVAFMTDDIAAQVRRMEAAGVEFTEPLKMQSWGGSAKFADPDGNVFWLLGAPAKFVRTERERRAQARRPARTRSKRRTSG
jgi:catechol 2,3-dioxygenase-like lactoylglutathione lyase family enzyme